MIDLLIVLGGALMVTLGGVILGLRWKTWHEARTLLDHWGPILVGLGLVVAGVFLVVGTGRLW